jgi:hypothetical protein
MIHFTVMFLRGVANDQFAEVLTRLDQRFSVFSLRAVSSLHIPGLFLTTRFTCSAFL